MTSRFCYLGSPFSTNFEFLESKVPFVTGDLHTCDLRPFQLVFFKSLYFTTSTRKPKFTITSKTRSNSLVPPPGIGKG